MRSSWVSVAVVLIPLEGVAGMAVNAVLLYYLSRTKVGSSARLYYISCIGSAISYFLSSLLVFGTIALTALVDGLCMIVFYGPILQYSPSWFANAIVLLFCAQIMKMWQILPAGYPAMADSLKSDRSRIAVAYTAPLAFYVIGWLTFLPHWLPTETIHEHMTVSVWNLHGTNTSDYRVYGFPLLDHRTYSLFDATRFHLLPTYAISYALLAICTIKIRERLRSLGASTSSKTAKMQRHFWRTQIAQGFMPLVLMSPSLGLAFFAATNLHNISAVISFLMCPAPLFTGLLLLHFVRMAAVSKNQSKVSDMQIVMGNCTIEIQLSTTGQHSSNYAYS